MKTKNSFKRSLIVFFLAFGFLGSLIAIPTAQAMNPTWSVTCYRTARYTKPPYSLPKVGTFPVSACSYQGAINKSNQLGVKFKDRYGCYSAKMTGCGQCGTKHICP